MKNKIFSLILLALLSLPLTSWAVGVNAEAGINSTSLAQEEVITDGNDLLPETEVAAEEEQTEPLEGLTAREKLVRKFLAAMLGVTASSLIIFVGLSVYNRVRENIINQVKTPEGETSLETPDDLTGAVKTFLDKTNWD